jgi:RNA polymerase sigma-B factor
MGAVTRRDGSTPVDELLARWSSTRDPLARDRLVEEFTPLALSLARRYGRSSEPIEDLGQVALLGLVKALDRFDAARGFAFATFAIPTILGELRRYFRDCGWAVRVPRRSQERAMAIGAAERDLTAQTGRAPTVNELAEFLEIDIEDVLDGLQAMNAYSAASLEAPGVQDDWTAVLGREDERFELLERRIMLAGAVGILGPRDRAILRMRFADELSQSQIGARLGISQMQVSRVLKRIFAELRAELESEPSPSGTRAPSAAR